MHPAPREAPVSPAAVLRAANAHRDTHLLFAAVDLGVFAALADGPLDAAALAARAGLHPGPLRDFLGALAGLGLLEREPDGRWRNSDTARVHLVPGSPDALLGYLGLVRTGLRPAWEGLAESLRTGKPANAAAADGDPYRPIYRTPQDREDFLAAMDVLNTPGGHALAALDWSGCATLLDVGGARGHLASILAAAHPGLHAEVFDLPDLEAACTAHAAASGVADRVRFRPGDFFRDEFPAADAVLLAHVLHNWPAEVRRMLLGKARRALPPGGRVVLYDAMIDEEDPQPANQLLSLDMLVWSAGGSEYGIREGREELRRAGFRDVERHRAGVTSTVLTARRA